MVFMTPIICVVDFLALLGILQKSVNCKILRLRYFARYFAVTEFYNIVQYVWLVTSLGDHLCHDFGKI